MTSVQTAPLGGLARQPERRRRPRTRVSWWFIVPALVAYGVVVVYPSLSGAYYAFTDWNGGPYPSFIGGANFAELVQDERALASLRNTLVLSVAVVIGQSLLGLVLALALNTAIRSRNLLRTLFFAPMLLPPIAIGVLWQFMYSRGGPIDTVLSGIGLDALVQNWLGDSSVALWSVIVTVVWQHVGLSMVIFLAGLQGVPEELYEAASLNGAGRWRRFWSITRPMIGQATTIVLALTMIGGLKLFDQVFVMTSGGPGYATETLSLLMYREVFVLGHYGYGTAIALVLTMIVAMIAFVQISATRRGEVEA
ncbi:carbohydrate ABC transporter permease [Occultella gossypii]|uniref:Sugar ABC transporter permease n=1 Tax=Occultella gossypii TaxID=2800820 RepID=A0ABS7S8H4_9MICO|nr:sugar ABC transporter permease [Occultella gossypii]MBZ2196045.1 sugar ABC transporter permease [Occultella gossypii]